MTTREILELIARIFLALVASGAAALWTKNGRMVGDLTPNQLVFLLTLLFIVFTL